MLKWSNVIALREAGAIGREGHALHQEVLGALQHLRMIKTENGAL
jgi:hypothetical protein